MYIVKEQHKDQVIDLIKSTDMFDDKKYRHTEVGFNKTHNTIIAYNGRYDLNLKIKFERYYYNTQIREYVTEKSYISIELNSNQIFQKFSDLTLYDIKKVLNLIKKYIDFREEVSNFKLLDSDTVRYYKLHKIIEQ